MYLIKSIVDILIVLFLLRLLIKQNEAYFDPIYRIIYRITDPLLIPSSFFTKNSLYGVLISILVLVLLRGFIYISIQPMSVITGLGISFMSLTRLLYQCYMVMLIISLLTQRSFGTSFMNMIQRAFMPLYIVSSWFKVPRKHFYYFSFLFLLILYAFLSLFFHNVLIPTTGLVSFSLLHGLGEGIILIISLFSGFFTMVIIVGALLSWVSPDPYNPVVQAIYGISEPLLAPFRRFVPPLAGLDISPIIAILFFQILGGIGQRIVAGLVGMI